MASIQKRSNGKWRARYRDPAGKEHARHFDRKADAERWLTSIESSKLRGDWIDPNLGRTTFAEWLERWQRGAVDLRPTTLARDLSYLRNHVTPRFGAAPLARITTSSVTTLIADMTAAGRHSPGTVRKVGQVFSKVMGAAVTEGLIARNPCEGVKLPPEPEREMRFLTAAQLLALADTVDPWYRVLVLSGGYLGLRWGELAGLRPDRVDLLRHRVHVVEQLTEVAGKLRTAPPKTSAGRRAVSVPEFLTEFLTEQLTDRSTSELVFPSPSGTPMRRSNFRQRIWVPACVATGLGEELTDEATGRQSYEGLRCHDLRHTAVALAISEGAHPKAIQSRMGHSSINVTLDRYGHLFPDIDGAIAEGLDATWHRALADSARTRRGPAPVREIGGR